MNIVFFIIGCVIVIQIFRFLGNSIQNVKYPHKTCPFCGNDVPGRRGNVAFNGDSFVHYNCTKCGAFKNANSTIWYRKKAKGNEYDYEMRMDTD